MRRAGKARNRGILHYSTSRTSVILPLTAAAAAIIGLMRWVRPPGP